jgi:hypothetical protein
MFGSAVLALGTLAVVGSTAFAYVQVPPGKTPPPPVKPVQVVVSMAPQPVKRSAVLKGKPHIFSVSLFSSNPTKAIKVSVKVLRGAFVTRGNVVFAVSNAQNLTSIQKAVGPSETVLTAFEMVTAARSIKPMIVTINSPEVQGTVSVFALHANGFGHGFHYIFVQPKVHDHTMSFVVNRNEPYIVVVNS